MPKTSQKNPRIQVTSENTSAKKGTDTTNTIALLICGPFAANAAGGTGLVARLPRGDSPALAPAPRPGFSIRERMTRTGWRGGKITEPRETRDEGIRRGAHGTPRSPGAAF